MRTSENSNLYLKEDTNANTLIAEIFVDDITFGGNNILCK